MTNKEALKELITKTFQFYDDDDSGYLEVAEIKLLINDICQEMNLPKISDKLLKKIVNKYDQNQDGRFELEELFPLLKHILDHITNQIMTKEQKLQKKNIIVEKEIEDFIRKIFNTYDLDESGYQERPELKKLLEDICEDQGVQDKMSDTQVNTFLKMVDTNGDGQIDIDEMLSQLGLVIFRLDALDKMDMVVKNSQNANRRTSVLCLANMKKVEEKKIMDTSFDNPQSNLENQENGSDLTQKVEEPNSEVTQAEEQNKLVIKDLMKKLKENQYKAEKLKFENDVLNVFSKVLMQKAEISEPSEEDIVKKKQMIENGGNPNVKINIIEQIRRDINILNWKTIEDCETKIPIPKIINSYDQKKLDHIAKIKRRESQSHAEMINDMAKMNQIFKKQQNEEKDPYSKCKSLAHIDSPVKKQNKFIKLGSSNVNIVTEECDLNEISKNVPVRMGIEGCTSPIGDGKKNYQMNTSNKMMKKPAKSSRDKISDYNTGVEMPIDQLTNSARIAQSVVSSGKRVMPSVSPKKISNNSVNISKDLILKNLTEIKENPVDDSEDSRCVTPLNLDPQGYLLDPPKIAHKKPQLNVKNSFSKRSVCKSFTSVNEFSILPQMNISHSTLNSPIKNFANSANIAGMPLKKDYFNLNLEYLSILTDFQTNSVEYFRPFNEANLEILINIANAERAKFYSVIDFIENFIKDANSHKNEKAHKNRSNTLPTLTEFFDNQPILNEENLEKTTKNILKFYKFQAGNSMPIESPKYFRNNTSTANPMHTNNNIVNIQENINGKTNSKKLVKIGSGVNLSLMDNSINKLDTTLNQVNTPKLKSNTNKSMVFDNRKVAGDIMTNKSMVFDNRKVVGDIVFDYNHINVPKNPQSAQNMTVEENINYRTGPIRRKSVMPFKQFQLSEVTPNSNHNGKFLFC